MVTIVAPVLAALAGLLVYILSANPKAAELGRILFACGALVSLVAVGQYVVRI